MKHFSLFLLLTLPMLSMAQEGEYYQKQPTKRTYTIVLKDGTELRGELIRQDSSEAVIQTQNLGEVRLKADQIVRMEQENVRGEGAVYPNPFPQTMRLTPTAFSAQKGKVYFRNYVLYFSQFEYGITDNWSVGTTFFTFVPTALFSLNTKVSVPVSGRVRLGLSAQYVSLRFDGLFTPTGQNANQGLGYVQGIVTTGDRQNNTTFGLGESVSNGDLSRNLVGTFGLVRKVSPGLTFISENLILFGSGRVDFAGVLSAGLRFDRRRHAFDLAAYVPLVFGPGVSPTITLVPFASYHLRIGK